MQSVRQWPQCEDASAVAVPKGPPRRGACALGRRRLPLAAVLAAFAFGCRGGLAAQAQPQASAGRASLFRTESQVATVADGSRRESLALSSSEARDSCKENTTSKCDEGNCAQDELGPSSCSGGWCVCKPGHCSEDGKCQKVKASEDTCQRNTATKCPTNGCASLTMMMGPLICNDGYCHCGSGFCYSAKAQRCQIEGSVEEGTGIEEEPVQEEPEEDADAGVEAQSAADEEAEKLQKEKANAAMLAIVCLVIFANTIVVGCFLYWGYRNFGEGRPPYGIKLLPDPPPPEEGGAEEGETLAEGEEDDGGPYLPDEPPPVREKEEEKLPPPEPEPQKEVVFYVEGAGQQDANGRYVLAFDTRGGKQYWVKKKAKASDTQYEIWFDMENEEWTLGTWPPGDADPSAKKLMLYNKGRDALPDEGAWNLGLSGAGAPAPKLKKGEEVVAEEDKVKLEPTPAPEVLYVISPNFDCGGEYVLWSGKQAQDMPVWKKKTEGDDVDFIFMGTSGRWVVGDDDEEKLNFACDTGNLMNLDKAVGRWPHQMPDRSWQRYHKGSWKPDPKADITLQKPKPKPKPKPPEPPKPPENKGFMGLW